MHNSKKTLVNYDPGDTSERTNIPIMIREAAGDVNKFRELYKRRFKGEPGLFNREEANLMTSPGSIEFLEIK